MLREHRLLNPALVAALARAGHGELIVVADAGLPLGDRPVIDISFVPGIPSFLDVARAVRSALCAEAALLAEESRAQPGYPELAKLLHPLPIEHISHQQFKARIQRANVIVRTGECTPFSNVVFVAGTTF